MPSCPYCAKTVPEASSVCPHCLRAQPVTIPSSNRSTSRAGGAVHGRGRLLILLALMLAGGAYAFRRNPREPWKVFSGEALSTSDEEVAEVAPAAAPVVQTTVAPPIEVRVADTGSVRLAGGKFLAFPFSGDGRSGCRVRGTVRAMGGSVRAADVMIVDRDGVAELEAGRRPRSYYAVRAAPVATIDANVDGRTFYSLVVENTGARVLQLQLKAITASCAD